MISRDTAARAMTGIGILVVGVLIAVAVMWFLPTRNPLPAQLARQDEKSGQQAADTTGRQVETLNRDATINIDLTTKEIRDAFDALPVASPPSVAGDPRPLPAAPVERVRDRLNEGISRANRAANAASAPD